MEHLLWVTLTIYLVWRLSSYIVSEPRVAVGADAGLAAVNR